MQQDDSLPVEVEWNGHDIPSGLARLPPGRYRIEPEWDLSVAEEAELEKAAAALDRGEGISADDLAEELRLMISAKRTP